MLAQPGAIVLLGGPGSGKTTLVKRLVRECALGRPEDALEHYPQMPWCFPVSTPMASLDEQRGECEILHTTSNTARGEQNLAERRQRVYEISDVPQSLLPENAYSHALR